jgi:hypothetical protein
MVRSAAVFVAAAAVAAGFASSGRLGTGTVACSTSSFLVSFDPTRRVVVSSSGRILASATFTTRSFGSACRRAAEPKAIVDGGLGSEIRSAVSFRCATSAPIRIHVNPIRNEAGKIVGSNLSVGTGSKRLNVVVSAILKNRGDPYASRVYRASSACKLGAR